jgi:hypothetical protein
MKGKSMRSIRIATLSVVLLVAARFTAFAEGFSLELGSVVYAFNIGGALQTPAPSTTITSSVDISPNVYLNGSYTMKLDGSTSLKLGLQAEDMMGTISPSFVLIGRAEPYADLATGALTVRVSFPLYILGYDATNDPSSAEIGYIMDNYYKGISLSTSYTSSNTFLFTNYENVAYKLTFDKATTLVLSASTEIGFVPAPWLYDVKPQLSLVWGPVQLDLKESIYLANNTSTSPSFSDQKYNLRFYTEPRLTFDFAGLGMPGLKAYLGASIFTYQSFPNTGDAAFYDNSSGLAAAFGSSITPGVNYRVGPFYIEATFKIHNYDDSVSNPGKKDPTFDPALRFSYTMTF